MNVTTARQRRKTYDELAQAFSEARLGLESEFTRLFLGPGRPVAYPYESVYREGRVMGDCALSVRQHYAMQGLGPEDHLLPDHVAVELEFMAHLAGREAQAWEEGDVDRAEACLRQQESFLGEHLARWLPSFCQRVLSGEAHPFYASLAQRAWEHVAEDMAQVRSWLSTAATGRIDEMHGWTVAVVPECTLCGLCTRVCIPRALRLRQNGGEMQLRFCPGLCDGCGACEQWCPERAVTVEPSPASEGADVVLLSSPLAICPGCGEPSLSAVLLDRLQERTAADNEGLRRRLSLCPTCKASSWGNALAKEDR